MSHIDWIHVKSRWNCDCPTVVIRIDADAHHPEQGEIMADTRRFIERMNDEVFGGRLYHESTQRGHAGYAVVQLQRYQKSDGTFFYDKKATINALIQNVQVACRALATQWGMKVSMEVQGGFTIFGTLDDGTKCVSSRSHPWKLPICPNTGDVAKLHGSVFPQSILHTIIGLAQSQPSSPPTPRQPAQVTARAVREINRSIQRTIRLVDPQDKNSRRARCLSQAMRTILTAEQWQGGSLTTDVQETILNSTNAIYHARGWNGGERDRARDTAFRNKIRWMLQTYDPASCGSGLRFGAADVARADEMIRSQLSQADIEELNADPKLKRCPLTYAHFAVAICTVAKNVMTSKGAVPITSIMGMLKHFELTSNGSQVAVIFRTLSKLRMLSNTHATYGPGFCCKYALGELMWSLPFIIEMKPVATEALKQQAKRYVPATSAGQHSLIMQDLLFVNKAMYLVGIVDHVDHLPCPSDPEYASTIDEMSADYEILK